APARAPTIDGQIRSVMHRRLPDISRRKPYSPPNEPGQRATVQVTFALNGSMPIQSSAGNANSVPPPTTELIIPAREAETKTTRPCQRFIRARVAQNGDAATRRHARMGRRGEGTRGNVQRCRGDELQGAGRGDEKRGDHFHSRRNFVRVYMTRKPWRSTFRCDPLPGDVATIARSQPDSAA